MIELPEQPSREAIAADLTTVARQGLKVRRLHLKLGSLGALGQLECVKSRPVEQRAEAIGELVTEAVESLPPGPPRDALEALLGMGTTAEMSHASRRSAEMQALGLDPTVTSEHSFRKAREKELLWDLAGAVADIAERDLPVTVTAQVPGARARKRGRTRPAVGASADLVVTHPLQIDPPNPRVGSTVTASFTVGRQGTGPEAVMRIAAGGRPDATGSACQRADPALSWNAPSADFPVAKAENLGAGRELTYRMQRTFDKPGWYFAEPVKQTDNGKWGGIPNANRVCFFVQGP